jgi:hypothetical protein
MLCTWGGDLECTIHGGYSKIKSMVSPTTPTKGYETFKEAQLEYESFMADHAMDDQPIALLPLPPGAKKYFMDYQTTYTMWPPHGAWPEGAPKIAIGYQMRTDPMRILFKFIKKPVIKHAYSLG